MLDKRKTLEKTEQKINNERTHRPTQAWHAYTKTYIEVSKTMTYNKAVPFLSLAAYFCTVYFGRCFALFRIQLFQFIIITTGTAQF